MLQRSIELKRLMQGVIEKYSHPGDVEQRVKLLAGGLEEWEGDLFARVLPRQGHLLRMDLMGPWIIRKPG